MNKVLGANVAIKATCDIHEGAANIFIPIRKTCSFLEKTKPPLG
jgi:hypothetical protein